MTYNSIQVGHYSDLLLQLTSENLALNGEKTYDTYRPSGVSKTWGQLETVGRGAGPGDTDYPPTARLSCIGNEILLFSCM